MAVIHAVAMVTVIIAGLLGLCLSRIYTIRITKINITGGLAHVARSQARRHCATKSRGRTVLANRPPSGPDQT